MNTRRVAVTGIGGITAFGRDWQSIQAAFKAEKNAVKYMDWRERFPELEAQLGAPIEDYAPPKHWTRKRLRSMGRVSYLCVDAAEQALADAGLLGDESITDGRMGVACGSSGGGTKDIGDVGELLLTGTSRNFGANTYVRMMPHTADANIGIFFGLTRTHHPDIERVFFGQPRHRLCLRGHQIRSDRYDAGGRRRRILPVRSVCFRLALCRQPPQRRTGRDPASIRREPRRAGHRRKGAGIFVLEELEHAKRRGAKIYAELVGYGANSDGINIGEGAAVFIMTRDADFSGGMQLLGYGASSDAYHISTPRPDAQGAILAFQTALQHAGLAPEDIGRINLHGTGTHHNDSMESRAVAAVFGNNTPCTSTKPQTGHTLGAAGAIEAAFAWGIADRQSNPEGKLPPRLWDGQNDPDLPAINLTGGGWETEKRIAASSSFAFGGSNCVLIIG